MKYVIILLLLNKPIYVPFDTTLSCGEQGEEIIEAIATYHGPGTNQGWYTDRGSLIYGFYCE
jgi:hypothetical protein